MARTSSVASGSSGRIVPPAADAPPTPSIVAPMCVPEPVGMPARCARASSATTKYCASSGISPSRFQVLPEREINASRVATPATIHCCSVAISRHVFCSPFSSRTSHWRSVVIGPGRTSAIASMLELEDGAVRCGAASRRVSSRPVSRARAGGASGRTAGSPTWVGVRLRILNMWPQFVHLTVTPPGLRRLSSSSYSVWHFSQRTSIGFQVLGRTLPRQDQGKLGLRNRIVLAVSLHSPEVSS